MAASTSPRGYNEKQLEPHRRGLLSTQSIHARAGKNVEVRSRTRTTKRAQLLRQKDDKKRHENEKLVDGALIFRDDGGPFTLQSALKHLAKLLSFKWFANAPSEAALPVWHKHRHTCGDSTRKKTITHKVPLTGTPRRNPCPRSQTWQ
jgi:hypothetical protein